MSYAVESPRAEVVLKALNQSGKVTDASYVKKYLSQIFSANDLYPALDDSTREKVQKTALMVCGAGLSGRKAGV